MQAEIAAIFEFVQHDDGRHGKHGRVGGMWSKVLVSIIDLHVSISYMLGKHGRMGGMWSNVLVSIIVLHKFTCFCNVIL